MNPRGWIKCQGFVYPFCVCIVSKTRYPSFSIIIPNPPCIFKGVASKDEKKRSRFVFGVNSSFRGTTIISFLTMLSVRLSVSELIGYSKSIQISMLKSSAIWPGTSALMFGGLRSLSSFCKAVSTAASIEKFVNSSIDPKTHNCAQFGAIL